MEKDKNMCAWDFDSFSNYKSVPTIPCYLSKSCVQLGELILHLAQYSFLVNRSQRNGSKVVIKNQELRVRASGVSSVHVCGSPHSISLYSTY